MDLSINIDKIEFLYEILERVSIACSFPRPATSLIDWVESSIPISRNNNFLRCLYSKWVVCLNDRWKNPDHGNPSGHIHLLWKSILHILLLKMVYKRVWGWTLGWSLPVLNFVTYPPPPGEGGGLPPIVCVHSFSWFYPCHTWQSKWRRDYL